ncbi:MAG: FAD-dependent oxidoreductase [Clostridiales Family XIII bacterium]|jgi:flavorubredoxin/NADPH-dependent 2,4-dienoyl-CoA reductase/sulfur reductase-like enzyme|nr:FAD-dependent oxidoreductase [Clostridiales Family XIII bacterium]
MKSKQIAKDFYWVGSLDPDLRVFDIVMETEFGTTYNSYVLKGSEKIALFESSKAKFSDSYLETLSGTVDVADIDYLIVNHTEPDHSGSVEKLLEINPGIRIVGSPAAVNFMKDICNRDFGATVVKDGDALSLGDKTLRFVGAPNLHWPDSMFTYVPEIETLISCDMFGCHYCSERITNEAIEDEAGYLRALRYYFDNIMGPFAADVLRAIEKTEDLAVKIIAPGHGPVLTHAPRRIVEFYREWASVKNPNARKTVVIPYVSAYGYTETLARRIAEGVRDAGDLDVRFYDLVTADRAAVLADIAWADGLLLGTPTIVGDALKPVWDLTASMFAKTHGGKFASAFGSYGWSGEGVPHILTRLSQLKFRVYGDGLRVKFKPNDAELRGAYEFGFGFGASVLSGKVVAPVKKGAKRRVWRCLVCGELVEGDEAPSACPVCGVGPDQFTEVEARDTDFVSEKKERFIIIGNGAAGTSACEEIRRRNKVCSIEMISRENIIGYNRPMLTKGILSAPDDINLFIKPYDWYGENDIRLTLNADVTEIDTERKELRLANGESRSYDKLILATGADAFRPPIPGAESAGVFAVRQLSDVVALRGFMKGIRSAAVIGGGVLGLEAAWELRKSGLPVSVVEGGAGLMQRQLDAQGSAILKAGAEKVGVTVHIGTGVAEILSAGGRAAGIRLADGTEIEAGLVLLSTGNRQNIRLATLAGIKADRSIEVNARMETSAPDVYACGDCAAYEGMNYGIWMQAVEMGKTAGINAVGDEAVYTPVVPSNAFSGLGLSLFAVGDNGGDAAKQYKTFEIRDAAKGFYEKFYFVNNRFSGGILIGDVSRSARLLEAYTNKESLESMMKDRLY